MEHPHELYDWCMEQVQRTFPNILEKSRSFLIRDIATLYIFHQMIKVIVLLSITTYSKCQHLPPPYSLTYHWER